jgi:hypothetical protein
VVVLAVLSPPILTLANEILPQLHRKAFKRGRAFPVAQPQCAARSQDRPQETAQGVAP